MRTDICHECGRRAELRGGVCAACRGAQPSSRRHDPDLEPQHDRPWVARSAFTGRKRRSPRS
jgi:hypothetical protein